MRNTYAQEEPLSQSKKYILVLSPDKTENRMKSEAKVISYGDSYVPVPGISDRKTRKRMIKAFVVIFAVVVIFLYLKFTLANKTQTNNASLKTTLRHINPCRHVIPEPEVILQEEFNSDDYFFPNSYKERICAAPNKTAEQDQQLKELQSCGVNSAKENVYHCVTRYKRFEVIRIPFPGNLTSKSWKVESVHIAVACECARTKTVKTYGT